jgi:SAM-dependent methyltransferase
VTRQYIDVPVTDIKSLQDSHWWWEGMRHLYKASLNCFPPKNASKRRAIDVGCGFGANLKILSEFADVVGVDPSLEALRTIRDRPTLGLVQARAEALPFRKDSFDIIALFAVIEHVKPDQQALEETHRIACPGAVQLLLTSAYMFLWSHHDVINGHYRRYLLRQIETLEQAAHWKVIRSSYVNTIIFPVVALVRLVQRQIVKGTASAYDMGPNWWPLKVIFKWFLALESNLILQGRVRLPFGVDIFSITRRDD